MQILCPDSANAGPAKQHGVKVSEKRRRPEIPDDGFEWVEPYLEAWAFYSRKPGLMLSGPTRSAGFLTDITGGYRDDGEDDQIVGFDRAIKLINATLDDCSEVERCALLHVHLYAVFRFPREPMEVIYQRVRQKIAVKLRANDFY